ncbi:MAG: DnaD domain protein [Anaerolineales bacterium]|nr:DnaD domain protein [Anaerolineales bacterium]
MPSSSGFPGFPEGRLKLTRLPGLFFSELLPAIDHLGELKLTLYVLWAVGNTEGSFPVFRLEQLHEDDLLLEGLAAPGMTSGEALEDALERCAARGTLLKVSIPGEGGEETGYILNSARGRAELEAILTGTRQPDEHARPALRVERPNIFTLYEQNIGPLTPMVAEHLRDAEQQYPAAWVQEAMEIAVANNVRRWRYIEAILERWQTEGRDERKDRGDSETARRRYVSGRYADFWDS